MEMYRQHVKGHALSLGMISDAGLKGSPGNEAADACATRGKQGIHPQTTGGIQELTTLITSSLPGRGRTDRPLTANATPDARTDEQPTTDDDADQGATDSREGQLYGDFDPGRRDDAGYSKNMHRAITGAIWGGPQPDHDTGRGDGGTNNDGAAT